MEVVDWRGRVKSHFAVAGPVGGAGVALTYSIGYDVLALDLHLPLALILLALWRMALELHAMRRGNALPEGVVDAFWGLGKVTLPPEVSFAELTTSGGGADLE